MAFYSPGLIRSSPRSEIIVMIINLTIQNNDTITIEYTHWKGSQFSLFFKQWVTWKVRSELPFSEWLEELKVSRRKKPEITRLLDNVV
jgi:hypothetical protein